MSSAKKRKRERPLPPLPPILSPELEDAALTHPALTKDHTSSYERLEFLGDAYIELIASRLIYPRFPRLTAGRLSQKRELLVKNETLAEYSVAYGFDTRAKIPSDFCVPGPGRSKLWTKTMGDLFEAYAAAVVLADPQNGFQALEKWLSELWAPKLYDENDAEPPLNEKAKVELSQKVGGKAVKLEYRHEIDPEVARKIAKPQFEIGAYLTGWGYEGVKIGMGKGLNKVDAGNRAAMEALESEVVQQAAGIKRQFDAKVKAEREKEAAVDGDKQD